MSNKRKKTNKATKAKIGRPRLPINEKATIRVAFYLSPNDVSVLPISETTATQINAWTRGLVRTELNRLRDIDINVAPETTIGKG